MEEGRKKKREHDFSVTAFRVVKEATGQIETESEQAENAETKKFDAVALGHLGGLKGGRARADKLTTEQRKIITQKAAKSRWSRQENH